ncbi:phage regulatory CII family protein [Acinetobacter bereziniae]|uniref:phage regulatory CII family protein n=1 Tax=Acinetobacter bereziniae TaxID=106648 RepID=UPI000C2BCB2D|nr:phage regulatory CII family protein [Acinetobacter bereziniae]ATZ64266.1 hypothetical protein BSR55_13260 [Acinetobacter bereziniae]MBJ9954963.1 hypothetical protein [Acinetobacter baumannii]
MKSFLSNYAAEHAVLPLDVALYRACKDRHGSKSAIAEIYGFNSMTFSKAVDVNNDQFHLKPEQIEAIASYTKDIRILQSMASMYENVAIYQYPNFEIIGDCSFLANIGEVSNKVGELFNGLSESLKDHIITDVEMAMIEKHAMELISAVATLKNLARKKSENDLKHEDH